MLPDPDPFENLSAHAKVDATLRRGFIRKVYGIVCAQLLLTAAVAALFTLNHAWRMWSISSPLISFFSGASVFLIMLLGMVPSLRHRHPLNMWLLAAFTLCTAFGVGQACAIVSVVQRTFIVLQALITSTVATGGLVTYALQTRFNLTPLNGALMIGLFSVLGASLVGILFPAAYGMIDFGISVVSALIFAGYVLVDTQLITRGSAGSDDYVAAALNVYLDIVNLFMALLKLLSSNEQRRRRRHNDDD